MITFGILSNDSVCIANQLGRLDFVSALLAAIALFLALAAIPYYWIIYYRIKKMALLKVTKKIKFIEKDVLKKTTKLLDDIRKKTEATLIKELESRIPEFCNDYFEIARNTVENNIANEVAESQEEE